MTKAHLSTKEDKERYHPNTNTIEQQTIIETISNDNNDNSDNKGVDLN